MKKKINRRLSVAPMLKWTTSDCRIFHRQLSKETLLYTEMITTGALIYGNKTRHLNFDNIEHPLALQLGGSDPKDLATCCKIAEKWQYNEVNLNLGCPSTRVQSGSFGACLMAEPALVADCIKAMVDSCELDITAKHRIGIDNKDSYAELVDFIGCLSEAGCQTFIIHARKAWLKGLSPKQNREIPPLHYDIVAKIKIDFPHLEIIINGGITSLQQSLELLKTVDGVMIGREAYQHPWLLAQADALIFNQDPILKTRRQIIEACFPYIETRLQQGMPLTRFTRHLLGLFHHQPNSKLWRRYLSENAYQKGADLGCLKEALDLVDFV